MTYVTPIIVPKVDWAALTELAQSTFGRSVTKMADQVGLKPNSPAAQIVVLESIACGDGKSAREMIEEAWGTTLAHLVYGFWVTGEPQAIERFLLTAAGLLTISGRDELIVSGNLLHWREALRAGLSSKAHLYSREIFTEIYRNFETIGLAAIFGRKKSAGDGTLLLEHHA